MSVTKFCLFLALVASIACSSSADTISINEFHYDNASGDVGEFVEIAVPAGTTLADITVSLYNGSGGAVYSSATADTFTPGDTGVDIGGSLFDLFVYSPSSIQNGGPDGIAVDLMGTLCEFISYEGDFAATDGPAMGVTSTDVGVSESSTAAVGSSIQLIDGVWTFTDGTNTAGAANAVPEPATISLLMLCIGAFAVGRRS